LPKILRVEVNKNAGQFKEIENPVGGYSICCKHDEHVVQTPISGIKVSKIGHISFKDSGPKY